MVIEKGPIFCSEVSLLHQYFLSSYPLYLLLHYLFLHPWHFSPKLIPDIDDDLRLRAGAGIVHISGFDHLDGLTVQRRGVEAPAQAQAADVTVGVQPEFDDIGALLSEAGGFAGIAEIVEGSLGDLDDPAQVFVDEAALRAAHT